MARALAGRYSVIEVAELARAVGAVRSNRGVAEVDLEALSRAVRRGRGMAGVDLVVGHLAHLLPFPDAVVLRCHPGELLRRLQRGRRGSPADRRANYICEATDAIVIEAVSLHRRVVEVDTTGRTIDAVAREVARCLQGRRRIRAPSIDWLADPDVTEHLLDRPS